MSPREGGLLSLAELLAKEGYGRKSASKSEADHGLAEASLPTSFSNGQTWRNSEPNHGGEPEIRKLYNHRPSRRASKGKRFSDQSIELSEEETSYIYKPCSNLLKYEMPKSGFKSASPPYGKFKVGECSKYLEHDRFEEENLDSWWKSGSLSNEPLIHHKSNVDIKGKTWICYQDKANSPRKICDRFRMKTQKKILKNIRRKSLPVNHTFDDESEINQHKHQECIDGGDTLQESTRYYDQNSVLLNNRVKDFSDSRKHLKPVQSICRRDHELERVEGRALIDHDAFQAVVLVINGYISQFMRDNSFRKTIGLHCYSCLGFDHQIEYGHCDDGFVVNMKRAIDCVERVADGYRNTGELKRAKFQLCVVADLNSDDLKDGFTCGIPNSDLAACAHLYLGILSKIQRKDKVSAKHILQVFCSSPFQARSLLLSELWECLFLPHLLYLRVWYSQEVDCIDNNLNGSSKIKLFDKVYNKLLDNGTYQLAVYYRDWLSNRAECPTIPSVGIPSGLAYGNLNEESHETFSAEEAIDGSCSVQPTITKNLLDAVFGYSSKTNFADEASHEKGKWSFDSCARSLNCVVERNDQADSPSSVVLDGIEQVTLKESLDVPTKVATHGCALLTPHETDDQLLTADESLGLPVAVSVGSRELVKNQNVPHGDMVPEKALLLPVSHGLESDLALKKLAKTVFHLDMQESTHHSSRNVSPSKMDMTLHDLVTERDQKESTFMTTESPYANAGLNEVDFLSSIPKDFICPITSQLFDDPVTLETGHTFERHAIAEWFERGNKTCPLTGQMLQSMAVPSTNLILKRVIELWKAKNWKHPLVCFNEPARNMIKHDFGHADESALSLLEQLVNGSNIRENKDNMKHLISLGGLQYLIQRFEVGNLKEKARVVSLFLSCIKADGGCRNYVAAKINKSCILELLHIHRSQLDMVLLLIELICLDRRVAVINFLDGLQRQGTINLMHILLVHLQNSPSGQRPLVAALLLHLVVLNEHKSCSIYREEALDAIVEACDCSLTDEKVRVQTCRALLVLEGLFSYGGKALTEAWLLKMARFNYYLIDSLRANENEMLPNDDSLQEHEEKARQKWLLSMGSMFVVNGKKLLWETFSKCLASGAPELGKACLIFVTWLSCALASLSGTQMKLSVFSTLAQSLKECLVNSDRVACRALASLSLLNFIEDLQCRQYFMAFAREAADSLKCISEVTWTAKKLHAIISEEIV